MRITILKQTTPLGAKIRELRHAKGLSVKRVASEVPLAPATLYQIENGYIETPAEEDLRGIARVLGTSYEALAKLAGKPATQETEQDKKDEAQKKAEKE